MVKVAKICQQVTWTPKRDRVKDRSNFLISGYLNVKSSVESSGICPNQLFGPNLNHLYDVPIKLISLVYLVVVGPKHFAVSSREQ